MSAKLTDFYVLKMNWKTKEMYTVKTHGSEFTHKGCLVRAYIDERHTMFFIDPKTGLTFESYCLPFVPGYDDAIERQYLKRAKRYIQWKPFRKYKKTIENNPEEHAVWIRKFEAAPRYESEQEALDDISKGM